MENTKIKFLGSTYNEHSRWGLFDKSGISPTLTAAMGMGGGYVPMILENNEPQLARVIGGLGEKKSNNGSQYFQQDRVYMGDIALCIPANLPGGSYKYMVNDKSKDIKVVGNIYDETNKTMAAGRVYDTDGIAPVLGSTNFGKERWILENNEMPKRIGNLVSDNYGTGFGYNVFDTNDTSPTIRTFCGGGQQPHIISEDNKMNDIQYRIRKLTPQECFRLMNFDDEDFYRAESCNSNTRLYSQAGNSIVVGCLAAIFSQLHIQGIKSWNEMTLEEQYELVAPRFSDNPNYEQDII